MLPDTVVPGIPFPPTPACTRAAWVPVVLPVTDAPVPAVPVPANPGAGAVGDADVEVGAWAGWK